MCNVIRVAVGKGDILILAAISLCPIKHGKAFLVISVWLYFSGQITSRQYNSCSQGIALEHQYLGRVLLRKDQTWFFRGEGWNPCQTRIPQLTENYLKIFNIRHRISWWNSPPSDITQKSEAGGGQSTDVAGKNTENLQYWGLKKNSGTHAGNKSCSGHFPAPN